MGREKKSNGTTRLTSVYILEIIKDAGLRGIRKVDIQQKLKEKYEQIVDERTLGNFLNDLSFGEKIETIEGTKKYILTEEVLSDDDLDILEDLITYSKGIDRDYVVEILEKTAQLRSSHSTSNKKYLADKLIRTNNVNVIENLKIIRKAISEKKQIEITLKNGKNYKVTPYEIIIFNSIYYIVCHYPERNYENNQEKLETRRVDRIESVRIMRKEGVDYREVVGNTQTAEFSIADYIAARIFPMSGDEISIWMKVPKSSENLLRENFLDSNIRVISNSIDEIKVIIKTNKKSFIPWYVSYAGVVGEVEKPVELREEIREYAQSIVDKYKVTKL